MNRASVACPPVDVGIGQLRLRAYIVDSRPPSTQISTSRISAGM